MIVAIGSSASMNVSGGQPSRAALRAEIARYQHQLSDCVNCVTAKTLEGKVHIQELSDKISVDQQRVKQSEAQQSSASETAAGRSEAPTVTYSSSGSADQSVSAAQGTLVNAFA